MKCGLNRIQSRVGQWCLKLNSVRFNTVSRKGAKKAKAQRNYSLCAFAFFVLLRETKLAILQHHLMKPASRLPAFIALLFVAGSAAGLFFQFYFHKYMNIDTLSYINIAELYASGKFSLAINGCWSPLYSWILATLLLIGIPALKACYVLNFIFAGACVYYLYRISKKYLDDPRLLALFNIFSALFFLNQALSVLTPDLLVAAIAFYIISLLIAPEFASSRSKQVAAGVAAGFLFFAKSYNFLFVITFLLVLALVNYLRRNQQPKLNAAYLTTGLIFLGVALCWIIPLSVHEGKITFSTAGGYVYRFVHPENRDHPSALRIIAPPFPEAYSSWIDPVHQLDSMKWTPFDNSRYFNYQAGLVKRSAAATISIIDKYFIKSGIMLVVLVVAFFNQPLRQQFLKYDLTVVMAAMIVYPLGYWPLFVIDRYILISILLFYLLFFYIIQAAIKFLPDKKSWIVIALSLLLIAIPGVRYIQTAWKQKSFEYGIYRAFHEQKSSFEFLKNKRIAATRDSYILSAQLSYLFKSRFYGIWNEADAEKAKAFNVEYVISGAPLSSAWLIADRQIPVAGYTTYIYKLKN